MISFKALTEENKVDTVMLLSEGLSWDAASYLAEIADGLVADNTGAEFALSVSSSCALIRIFDMGRYYFAFPYALDGDADVATAIDEVCEYAMREEIPLVFTDVPSDSLSSLVGFRHIDIDAEDKMCETYRVRIKTECEIASEIPSAAWGRVELNSLSESDIPLYAELCKDENVNKYWYYNYSDDVAEPKDDYFFENALLEFRRGVAVNMAIRVSDSFAGEASIYAFDGRGNAELSVRLLRGFFGQGLGRESVMAIKAAARKLGLIRLYARVMKENERSIKMMSALADAFEDNGDVLCFVFELYPEK